MIMTWKTIGTASVSFLLVGGAFALLVSTRPELAVEVPMIVNPAVEVAIDAGESADSPEDASIVLYCCCPCCQQTLSGVCPPGCSGPTIFCNSCLICDAEQASDEEEYHP